MKFDQIIFDLDGTLIDSSEGILQSFRSAFSEVGVDVKIPITCNVIGPPLRSTLELLSSTSNEVTIDKLEMSFKKSYDQAGFKATKIYPGIEDMIKYLHNLDIKLFIATNKRQSATSKIIDWFNWKNFFKGVYSLDSFTPPLKEKSNLIYKIITDHNMSAFKVLYVGDRFDDKFAADKANCNFLFASWGYTDFSSFSVDQISKLDIAYSPEILLQKLDLI